MKNLIAHPRKKKPLVVEAILLKPRKKERFPSKDWIKHIATTSYDVMWDWNLLTGEMYVGESIRQVFGFIVENNLVHYKQSLLQIPESDREKVHQKLNAALASTTLVWQDQFPFIMSDGRIAMTMSRADIIRDEEGKALRMIGAIMDVTRLQELENKLKRQSIRKKEGDLLHEEKTCALEALLAEEIGLHELQIASAVVDSQELQRSELGRELHDNVNQLLGASRLYLNMARTKPKDIDHCLQKSEEYTSMAIEAIRALAKTMTTDVIAEFGLLEAVHTLVTDTMQAVDIKIHFVLDQNAEAGLHLKFKLNLYRIMQEQMNNILKYAHAREVKIVLSQNAYAIILSIEDDGTGFNTDDAKSGIGLANITSRARSFNGAVNLISRPGEGCTLKIIFPISPILFLSKS